MLLPIIVIASCSSPVKDHKDPFYNDAGTHDSLKLPLINPYYLVYIDKEHGWQMPIKGNFPDEQYYYNLGDLMDVRKVAVRDGVIMIYTPHIPNLDESLGQKALHWFIIIPDKGNFEIAFDTEPGFLNYIQGLGINQPQWVVPDTAYKEFYETGCFDWIPDCE